MCNLKVKQARQIKIIQIHLVNMQEKTDSLGNIIKYFEQSECFSRNSIKKKCGYAFFPL